MTIRPLHYITTNPRDAELACRGGIRWVQLRVKNTPYAAWKQLALDTQAVCRHHGATLILNDNPQLAQEIGADGVHLGLQDMPTTEARALLGPSFIIGGTANTLADIERHAAAGVDYVGLGPFRFTTTKDNLSPLLGLDGYSEIMQQCRDAGITTPVIGIGGIEEADVALILSTLIDGIAVSSAIGKAADPTAAARVLVDHVDFWRGDYD